MPQVGLSGPSAAVTSCPACFSDDRCEVCSTDKTLLRINLIYVLCAALGRAARTSPWLFPLSIRQWSAAPFPGAFVSLAVMASPASEVAFTAVRASTF